jgi:hypothetical protein
VASLSINMASLSNIPLPAPLKTTASNLAAEWKRFKGQWQNYVKAAKVDKEELGCQAAIFLACIGVDAYAIYDAMEFDEEEHRSDPERLIAAFEQHCIGETNEVYERYVFNSRKQDSGETFDVFLSDLRRLVKSCEYGAAEDSMIRDRIVLGLRDDATRRKLLGTRKLDLTNAIDICRAQEATARQFKAMTAPEEVHTLRREHSNSRHRSNSRHSRHRSNFDRRSPSRGPRGPTDRRCKYCNRMHEPSKRNCPAFGATCKTCGKRNHFAVVCKSASSQKVVQQLDEDESLLALDDVDSRRVYSSLYVDGKKIRFLLDCGSTVNILPRSVAAVLRRTNLRPPRAILRMFDRKELPTVGMLTATLKHPRTHKEFEMDFYVTEREVPILGLDACRRMDLLRIVEENICEVHETLPSPSPSQVMSSPPAEQSTLYAPPTTSKLTEADILAQYADVFDGSLGLLEGDVHFEVDKSVKPVQLPLRRIPVAMRDRVETELNRMISEGIIAPVTEPTRWVSALLVVAKANSGIRIVIDPRPLNKALVRSTYCMPTIDDLLPKLSGVKVFSTVDAKDGFFHLKLDEESSYLTTCDSIIGRIRWLRMPNGISVAPEVFQARIHSALTHLRGVHCIADDVLITGKGETVEEAQRDHDANLIAFLNRCRQKRIKLNRKKVKLNRSSVTFMGHELTENGLRPSAQKIEAIVKMPSPTDKTSLQRLLGFATFLARYCKNFSETTAVLRELLVKDHEFSWSDRHDAAFNQLKQMLTSAPVLQYFSTAEGITIQADASQYALGAVLVQKIKLWNMPHAQ